MLFRKPPELLPPWIEGFSVEDGGTMIAGKDNADLLVDLLHVHLALSSMQAIKGAGKTFKQHLVDVPLVRAQPTSSGAA